MNNLYKIQKRIIVIIITIVIGIIGYYIYGRENSEENVIKNEEIMVKQEETEQNEKNGKIVIHITGAVKNEGVITLEENSRIFDAVEAAGGLTEDADMSKINLAFVLEDGIKVRIPSKNDVEEEKMEEELTDHEEFVENMPESNIKSEKGGTGVVNINKATQTELETLPGIGPSIALKIINYREENGKFSSIDDLKKVSGIGESKFENIKNLISVK